MVVGVLATLPESRIRQDSLGSWPNLGGGEANPSADDLHLEEKKDSDWNFVDSDDIEGDMGEDGGEEPKKDAEQYPTIVHRSESTPDFGSYDEATGPLFPAKSEQGIPLPPASPHRTPTWGPPPTSPATIRETGGNEGESRPPKRSPSFVDILKANATKKREEEEEAARIHAETAEMLRREREEHRRARAAKIRLVVTPIKRCSHSTGDLKSLTSIHEHVGDDGYDDGGGGGGGGDGGHSPLESEVLGSTDAMDFYHRKEHGARSRASGQMERPDEAKRKEISMYKKEVQRKKQQAADAGGGGGKGKGKGKGKGSKGAEGGGGTKKNSNKGGERRKW